MSAKVGKKKYQLNKWSIQRQEWFKTLTDTRKHFTIKNECEKKKTFSITTRSIGQFF